MTTADVNAVVAALRDNDRFVVTSHDNPDGDALGSLLATHLALQSLGKDSVMVLGGPAPLPGEYRFLGLEAHGLLRTAPADTTARVLVAVDCAQRNRIVEARLTEDARLTVNIDHHHDNTRFGDVNLVAPSASCTAEIVFDIARLMGVTVDAEMAMPLYVGLITDTGKFMYENTNAHTHRVAAELIDAGVDVDDTYRRLYEHVPIEKLRLVARALEKLERHCGERLVTSNITAEDYAATGSGEEMTAKCHGWWLAPDGAVPAARIASSISLRGTGALENMRQLRRLAISARNARVRSMRSSSLSFGRFA